MEDWDPHTLGGVDGLVGGFQFVHWYKPQKYYQYSRNCDLLAVIEPLFQALRATHDDASLLVMSANNDDRDTMRKWDLAQDKSVAFNSVASSAGSTATMAVVVQSAMGHLNGRAIPLIRKCYARATVAATRSQSLTVILSQIDMMSIIGMIQVLAARTHLIQEVYQATSNWTMPELRTGETQLEQSDREIASWRLNHAGHWQEQTEPPLSIFHLKTKVGGKSADMKPARLRLILVSAADVRGAESWLGPLKTCRDSGQIYPWMPFFLRLPIGQYGSVSQLSRSEESCTGPFNWGEAHCAGEKVKRKIGPFLRKSLNNQTRTRTQQKGAQPATATRNPLARLPGARAKEEKITTNKRLHKQILVRLNVLDLQWTIL